VGDDASLHLNTRIQADGSSGTLVVGDGERIIEHQRISESGNEAEATQGAPSSATASSSTAGPTQVDASSGAGGTLHARNVHVTRTPHRAPNPFYLDPSVRLMREVISRTLEKAEIDDKQNRGQLKKEEDDVSAAASTDIYA
jgi:hypothetical protein